MVSVVGLIIPILSGVVSSEPEGAIGARRGFRDCADPASGAGAVKLGGDACRQGRRDCSSPEPEAAHTDEGVGHEGASVVSNREDMK